MRRGITRWSITLVTGACTLWACNLSSQVVASFMKFCTTWPKLCTAAWMIDARSLWFTVCDSKVSFELSACWAKSETSWTSEPSGILGREVALCWTSAVCKGCLLVFNSKESPPPQAWLFSFEISQLPSSLLSWVWGISMSEPSSWLSFLTPLRGMVVAKRNKNAW